MAGRGRSATLPAWMTDPAVLGENTTLPSRNLQQGYVESSSVLPTIPLPTIPPAEATTQPRKEQPREEDERWQLQQSLRENPRDEERKQQQQQPRREQLRDEDEKKQQPQSSKAKSSVDAMAGLRKEKLAKQLLQQQQQQQQQDLPQGHAHIRQIAASGPSLGKRTHDDFSKGQSRPNEASKRANGNGSHALNPSQQKPAGASGADPLTEEQKQPQQEQQHFVSLLDRGKPCADFFNVARIIADSKNRKYRVPCPSAAVKEAAMIYVSFLKAHCDLWFSEAQKLGYTLRSDYVFRDEEEGDSQCLSPGEFVL